MSIVFALVATMWWIAIWGLFELATKNYTDEEKARTYFVVIALVIVVVCFFPRTLNHF
jgi:hypothetical protein